MKNQSKFILSVVDTWWHKRVSLISLLLLPWSLVFMAIVMMRKLIYRSGLKPEKKFDVPVIVVGNIVVGGTGKTPLVLSLVKLLKDAGYRPGIVSRGYGAAKINEPIMVQPHNDPAEVGDEPILLAQRTGAPMVICIDRPAAVKYLIDNSNCNIILSDDGMQHFSMARAMEILVVDGERQFGNGLCLPAGPLREPVTALARVDWIVCNGKLLSRKSRHAKKMVLMELKPEMIRNIVNESNRISVESLSGKTIHAVAGIGNPKRFFDQLRAMGLTIVEHAFSDHYRYKRADIDFGEKELVIMTEKDSVKCKTFADERHFYLPVEATLPDSFKSKFLAQVKQLLS